jgi:hypothetical protein
MHPGSAPYHPTTGANQRRPRFAPGADDGQDSHNEPPVTRSLRGRPLLILELAGRGDAVGYRHGLPRGVVTWTPKGYKPALSVAQRRDLEFGVRSAVAMAKAPVFKWFDRYTNPYPVHPVGARSRKRLLLLQDNLKMGEPDGHARGFFSDVPGAPARRGPYG